MKYIGKNLFNNTNRNFKVEKTMAKSTDFRYNTGATRVPWAAVGENYNVHDLMEIIRFLKQGEGKEYDDAMKSVWK